MRGRKVSKNVASNPVARMFAWKRMVADLRDWKVAIWGFAPGTPIPELVGKMATYCTSVLLAAKYDKIPGEDPLIVSMNGLMDLLTGTTKDGCKWHEGYVLPIDDALDACALLVRRLSPMAIKVGLDATEPKKEL